MCAQAAALDRDKPLEPRPVRKLAPDGVLGMLLFVFAEAMLFAGLISAFVIVKAQAAGAMWPPYGQPRLPVERTAINTTALLLSGAVLLVSSRSFGRRSASASGQLLTALLLGAFFVGFQGVEWLALIREGLTLTSSTYGSFFYLIVGTHAVHALGAIVGLAWAWTRLRAGRLTEAQFATVRVFWYFVVLVWPVLYLKVYL